MQKQFLVLPSLLFETTNQTRRFSLLDPFKPKNLKSEKIHVYTRHVFKGSLQDSRGQPGTEDTWSSALASG